MDEAIGPEKGPSGAGEHPEAAMRLEPRPARDCPWYLRPFFWNQRRKYGEVLRSALLWARSPRLFLGVAALYGAIDRRRSPLDPALRSLVTVRVSQLNGCRFCVDLNAATLIARGVPLAKVEALDGWRESGLFDAHERLALDYAEAMTGPGCVVDDGLWARLAARFDEDSRLELTALVAFQNLSSRFNAALRVPAQGFCPIPGAKPASAQAKAPHPREGPDRGVRP